MGWIWDLEEEMGERVWKRRGRIEIWKEGGWTCVGQLSDGDERQGYV